MSKLIEPFPALVGIKYVVINECKYSIPTKIGSYDDLPTAFKVAKECYDAEMEKFNLEDGFDEAGNYFKDICISVIKKPVFSTHLKDF
jgi:hypothetical protein